MIKKLASNDWTPEIPLGGMFHNGIQYVLDYL